MPRIPELETQKYILAKFRDWFDMLDAPDHYVSASKEYNDLLKRRAKAAWRYIRKRQRAGLSREEIIAEIAAKVKETDNAHFSEECRSIRNTSRPNNRTDTR